MFNKKIVSDFTPRKPFIKRATPLPVQEIPQPPIPEPPPPPPQEIPVKVKKVLPPPVVSHKVKKNIEPMIPKIAPSGSPLTQSAFFAASPLTQGSTLAPAASFSPSLETFPGTGKSYFKLSSDTSDGPQNWWKFPAAGPVDISGFNIVMQGGNIYGTNELVANTAEISSITTNRISSLVGTISSMSTSQIVLDGATLTTAGGTELLLNGTPIATISDLPNLAEWSFDPAISTINANGYPIVNATDLQVSTINGGSISSISAANWSAYPAQEPLNMNSQPIDNVSTINGFPFPQPISGVTSLNAQSGTVAITSAGNTVTITNPTPGTINLETAGSGPSPSTWAIYPAISTVTIPDQNFQITNAAGGLSTYFTADINANLNVGNIQNAPLRPNFNAYVDNFTVGSIVSPTLGVTFNSLGGINLNSLVGISLAGGGGIAITGVGGINLQGGGAINVASGGILVSGGGIAVSAGGLAINGGGIQVGAGGFAVTGGNVEIATSTTMGTISARGGEFKLYGNNLKLLSTANAAAALFTDYILSPDNANTMQITGVSTINGIAFPPPTPGVNPNITLSTLTAANYVSTPTLYADSLFGTSMNIGNISTGTGITVGTNATEINMTADVFIDAPHLLSANELTDCAQASISSIINLSTINGVAYPPVGGPGVSSLNSLTGAITLAAGTNVDITPSGSTLTIQAKNYPISERATSITPVNLTAVTFVTAQTILTYTITPTFVSDIDVTCSFTYQTNSNTIYDIIFFITIDGIQAGVTMRNSLGGANHFNCVTIVGSALLQTAGLHTIAIKAYAGSAPAAGNLTVTAVSAVAIANLV